MKRKSIKVAKSLINFLMVLILLLSLGTLALTLSNSFSYNIEVAKYIYLLIGVFLLPIEFLVEGTVGLFQNQESNLVCMIVSFVLIFLSITVLVNSSKMFNGKYSSTKRTLAGTITNLLIFVFFAFFLFGAIIFSTYFPEISNVLNNIGPEGIKTLVVSLGFNLIVVKEIIIAYVGALISAFTFIFFVVGMSHKSTKVKIISSIGFYSSQYEEQKTDSVAANKQETLEEQTSNEIKESDPDAKSLIDKIMQLDELRKAGKISNSEYTRLRQKAIRRYKN